jgi:hypothetical protein
MWNGRALSGTQARNQGFGFSGCKDKRRRAAAQKFYCGAGLTLEQNMNIIVPQAAMDQIPSCIVQLWIKKGISL